jgi:calcium-dependent protein kinase
MTRKTTKPTEKPTENVLVFINDKVTSLEDLLLNKKCSYKEITSNIYSLSVDNKDIDWLVKTYDKKKYAERESNFLKLLENVKGVPKVFACALDDNFSCIVLSKIEGCDLHDYVTGSGVVSYKRLKSIAKQVLTILKGVHKNKIVHKDIKPENIMYDKKKDEVTLIDFEGKQTDRYCSPEQINNNPVTYKTDVWSTGVTLYFLASGGQLPFKNNKEVIDKDIKLPKDWNSDFKDFLECVLQKDVDVRYSVKECLKHTWIN